MSIKQLIKSAIAHCGYELVKKDQRPRSDDEPSLSDPFHEHQGYIGRQTPATIFDVGAHQGETALKSRYCSFALEDRMINLQVPSLHSVRFASCLCRLLDVP